MEYRKLIKFGNSSHVISIPRLWMEKHGLDKGDHIYFFENGNNELVLSHEIKDKKVKLKKTVIAIDGRGLSDIKKDIVAAYVKNSHIIEIKGKEINERKEELRKNVQDLMAMEIVEQNDDHMIVKDYLNMKKISVFDLITKIDLVIKEMLKQSHKMFDDNRQDNIEYQDTDVNRLVHLVKRVCRYALENPHLIYNVQKTPFDFFRFMQIADKLEKVGDEAKRISRIMHEMKLEEKQKEEFLDIYKKVIENYHEMMDLVLAKETDEAKIKSNKSLMTTCNKFRNKNHDVKGIPVAMEKMKSIIYQIYSIGREIY